MSKALIEAKEPRSLGDAAPPLSASVRRHLGKSLRTFYATALSEPVSERMEALLVRLDKPVR